MSKCVNSYWEQIFPCKFLVKYVVFEKKFNPEASKVRGAVTPEFGHDTRFFCVFVFDPSFCLITQKLLIEC